MRLMYLNSKVKLIDPENQIAKQTNIDKSTIQLIFCDNHVSPIGKQKLFGTKS